MSQIIKDISGTVFHIQRFSVNDGPGIRTTVFFKGCPLHCSWCHNPESISSASELALRPDRCIQCGDCITACNNQAIYSQNGSYATNRSLCQNCGECVDVCNSEARTIIGKKMSVQEVMAEIRKDVTFFQQSAGGATFSGGEPLFQHEFLLNLLQSCHQEGIHTIVDTTGFTSETILELIAKYIDLFLYDLKMMNDTKHRELTGISNQIVLENLRKLAQFGKKIIIRFPLIPTINDDEENIHSLGEFVKSLRTIQEIHILPFHHLGSEKRQRIGSEHTMATLVTPSSKELHSITETLNQYIPRVIIGG